MASAYPGALDALTNPSSTDAMDSTGVPHAALHSAANDAIESTQLWLNDTVYRTLMGVY